MYLHKLVHRVFFSLWYFWWPGKKEEEDINKIGNARKLGKRLGLSCKPYMYMIVLTKLKIKKEENSRDLV